jgi:hypothetical protein
MALTGHAPGWWQASDGNWYPPETHPTYRPPAQPPAPTEPATESANQSANYPTQPGFDAAHTHYGAAPGLAANVYDTMTLGTESTARHRSKRPPLPLLIALGVVVIGVVAYFGVTQIFTTNNALHTGAGTATVSWTPTHSTTYAKPAPQPFTGTIDGLQLSGTASAPTDAKVEKPGSGVTTGKLFDKPLKSIPIQDWNGTLGGTPFSVDVTMSDTASFAGSLANKTTTLTLGQISLNATGTFGSQDVTLSGTVTGTGRDTISFHGTIGNLSVRGTVQMPSAATTKATAGASFTVTG